MCYRHLCQVLNRHRKPSISLWGEIQNRRGTCEETTEFVRVVNEMRVSDLLYNTWCTFFWFYAGGQNLSKRTVGASMGMSGLGHLCQTQVIK